MNKERYLPDRESAQLHEPVASGEKRPHHRHLRRFPAFILTGSMASLFQLLVLDTLDDARWQPLWANLLAVILSTQLNFVLSYLFTWRDRRPRLGQGRPEYLLGRWVAYHEAVGGSAILSIIIFLVTHGVFHVPILVASLTGTTIAATINYITGDRFVFRLPSPGESSPAEQVELCKVQP